MTHIALQGALNLRDLGGIGTQSGHKITDGRLFRSDALGTLTDPDVAVLTGLGLRTAIDFRSEGEVAASGPDRLPPGAAEILLPVDAGDLDGFIAVLTGGDLAKQRELLGDGKAAQFMRDINRQFVAEPRFRAQFGRALHLIAGAKAGHTVQPVLYHCSAGKDRTGWMTAIVLTALGVPRDVVLADYLASNDYVWPAYQPLIESVASAGQLADPDLVRPLLVQDPSYLDAAFAEAESRYGDFAGFLAEGLDFTPADTSSLRSALLT